MTIQISKISKVLIVVEPSEQENPEPVTARMVSALRQVIATSTNAVIEVKAVTAVELNDWMQNRTKEVFICPLTLNLPPNLSFHAQSVYQACRDVSSLRQRVEQLGGTIAPSTGCANTNGCFWLPIVLTAKGPLYGEVIGLSQEATGEIPDLSANLSYYQPFHLSDRRRQQVYQIGHSLLQLLSAPPATYLMQFGFQGFDICFDRLLPFPAAPAIASLGVQEPDLFACHWYCLASLPILDLSIITPLVAHTCP